MATSRTLADVTKHLAALPSVELRDFAVAHHIHPLPRADSLRLALACMANIPEMALALVRKNPGLLNAPVGRRRLQSLGSPVGREFESEYGLSPVNMAIQAAAWNTVDVLIEELAFDVNWQGSRKESRSVLSTLIEREGFLVAGSARGRLADRLLSLGADPFLLDDYGQSPFCRLLDELPGPVQRRSKTRPVPADMALFSRMISAGLRHPRKNPADLDAFVQELNLNLWGSWVCEKNLRQSKGKADAKKVTRWTRQANQLTGLDFADPTDSLLVWLIQAGLPESLVLDSLDRQPAARAWLEKTRLEAGMPLATASLPRQRL